MGNGERHTAPSLTLPRSFWYSCTIAMVLFVALTVALTLSNVFHLVPEERALAVSLPSTLISFLLSWIGFPFPTRRRRRPLPGHPPQHSLRSLASFLFSMALAAQFLGNIIHVYYNIHHNPIYPSWGDAALWAASPLLLLGLLCLPTQAFVKNMRLRLLLDSLLIIIALATFNWYFLLGPTLRQAPGQSMLATITHIAFPAADLLLMSYVILFAASIANDPRRPMVRLLLTAMVIFIVTDSVYQYQLLKHYVLPGWCVLGWCAANFMISLAVQSMHWLPPQSDPVQGETSEQTVPSVAPIGQILLPYVLIPAVFALAFYLWETDRMSTLAIGTYCLSVLLLTLIFVKQVLAIREIHWLNRKLHLVQGCLYEKNAALEQANTRLRALAATDSLTGLPNHRTLQTILEQEMEQAQRSHQDCTLLFFDLDHFKVLNDEYGHAAGDQALVALSHLLQAHMRSTDTLGRWGGEEFLSILPETPVREASVLAQSLCMLISQHVFPLAGGLHLTCSIGVASYPAHATRLNDLVNAADQAMYAAKRLGRNQWRSINDPEARLAISAKGCVHNDEEITSPGVVEAFVSLIERREAELGDHSREVARLVEQIALKLGSSPQEAHMMNLAGLLHDIGKVGIPDAILQKPARLTKGEWEQMKLHPAIGAQIIANIPSLGLLAPVIRAHHERWDGTGYPDQLQAKAIPLAARVVTVADAYMAMVVDRPHQKAHSREAAMDELQRCAGTQFDPLVVEALRRVLHEQDRSIMGGGLRNGKMSLPRFRNVMR